MRKLSSSGYFRACLGRVSSVFALASLFVTNTGSAVAADAINAAPPAGYDLTLSFSDDFNGATLNPNNWINVYAPRNLANPPVTKRNLWGNGELECYFDTNYLGLRINPFTVANGILTITANPLSAAAKAAVRNDLQRNGGPYASNAVLQAVSYSSGLISTRDAFSQKYGYFEMRARWSSGKGMWPGFWLLPEDGSWPPEIDVVEALGNQTTTAYQSVHSSVEPKNTTKAVALPIGNEQDFHRYGMLWTKTVISYYIDGVKTASIATPADMNKPMYILANLAVGGYWPGAPDASTKFPAVLQIDYIKAWKLNNS